MADRRFVSDKPLTFDSDLDLGHGNLNFEHDTPSQFDFFLLCTLIKFRLSVFELWLTRDL